jgi:glutaredoxin-related protein
MSNKFNKAIQLLNRRICESFKNVSKTYNIIRNAQVRSKIHAYSDNICDNPTSTSTYIDYYILSQKSILRRSDKIGNILDRNNIINIFMNTSICSRNILTYPFQYNDDIIEIVWVTATGMSMIKQRNETHVQKNTVVGHILPDLSIPPFNDIPLNGDIFIFQ